MYDPFEHMPEMPQTPENRTSGRRARHWLKIAAAATALLGILVGGVIIGANISAARAANSPSFMLTGQGNQQGMGPMMGGKGHFGGPDLTITSISGSTIKAKTSNGTAVTITTNASTKYTRAGQTVSQSALAAGDEIHVRGTRQSDGSIVASQIDIELPHYAGSVTSVSGATITVTDRQGSHVIHTDASTTFMRDGQKVSLSAVTKGTQIAAEGALNSDKSMNAVRVEIMVPHAGGTITAISGNTITVKDPRGTETIHVSGSTSYVQVQFGANGPTQTNTSLSALKTGMWIMASGTKNSDGSLNAEQVRVFAGVPPMGGHFQGGPHHGRGGSWGQAPASGQPAAPQPAE